MITQKNAILVIYFRRDLSETDARLPDLLALNAHFNLALHKYHNNDILWIKVTVLQY